jgi:hypothetical protein
VCARALAKVVVVVVRRWCWWGGVRSRRRLPWARVAGCVALRSLFSLAGWLAELGQGMPVYPDHCNDGDCMLRHAWIRPNSRSPRVAAMFAGLFSLLLTRDSGVTGISLGCLAMGRPSLSTVTLKLRPPATAAGQEYLT